MSGTGIARIVHPASGQPVVARRDTAGYTPLGVGSLAALLALPLAEIRAAVEGAGGAALPADEVAVLPPVDGRMEVWAAGVTYERSRDARVEESDTADVYQRVYEADRPELFLKSVGWRVVTDGQPIGIRADSGHDVPEAELAVVGNAHGEIAGYLVCNDVSSRTIEGENPLYLPQAKVYDGSCALSGVIRPAWEVPDPQALAISAEIRRGDAVVWHAATSTARMRRPVGDLVDWLTRGLAFPDGMVLATGTGIVPDLEFRLRAGDVVTIAIDGVGVLRNEVAVGTAPFGWLAPPAPAQ